MKAKRVELSQMIVDGKGKLYKRALRFETLQRHIVVYIPNFFFIFDLNLPVKDKWDAVGVAVDHQGDPGNQHQRNQGISRYA